MRCLRMQFFEGGPPPPPPNLLCAPTPKTSGLKGAEIVYGTFSQSVPTIDPPKLRGCDLDLSVAHARGRVFSGPVPFALLPQLHPLSFRQRQGFPWGSRGHIARKWSV